MKTFLMAATAISGMVLSAGLAHAGTTLVPGSGWVADAAPAIDTPSSNSPITLTVAAGVMDAFSITDCCIAGDVYQVSEGSSQFATFDTTFSFYPTYWTPGSTGADADWVNSSLSHGQIVLGPGTYDITIEDTSDVEYPAGFSYRADVVAAPEPASMTLLAVGAAGLGAFRRRRRGRG